MATGNYSALVLEDEPLISMDLEIMLQAEGFDVTSIMSCLCADAWLDTHHPDVVIVDIELRDGPCALVAARLVAMRIPFVVHSGDHSSLHAGTPFAWGAWMNKPASPMELMAAVRGVIEDKAPRRVLQNATQSEEMG